MRKIALGLILSLTAGSAVGLDSTISKDKQIYGYIERVLVSNALFTMNAKLDTGADTSSLDAQVIKRFKRGGKRWVRFSIVDPATDQAVEMEKELVREVRIKSHFGRYSHRPVVQVPICLGGHYLDTEVSLVDRANFNYPVLLGRLALAGRAVVDPDASYLHEPNCPEAELRLMEAGHD